jgi:hypothetical protein
VIPAGEPDSARYDETITGVPLWLCREYAEEIGGVADADGVVVGQGWQLMLEQASDYVIGSLRVGRVRLLLEGAPEAVAEARAALERKLLRAGG